MALINKLFARPFSSSQVLNAKSDSCLLPSNKRHVARQQPPDTFTNRQQNGQHQTCTQQDTHCGPSNRGAAQMRLLLFSECEVRGGRRLIFDSLGGGGDSEKSNKSQKGDGQEVLDDQLVKDMVFGSATLRYSGENCRFHDFGPSQWKGYEMMLTKVFPVPPVAAPALKPDSRAAKDSGYVDGDSATSLASTTTSAPSSAIALNAVTRSRPERNAVSDSLLAANANRNKAGHLRSRKVRLAIALLFLPSDSSSSEISVRDVIHEQFALVEHFVQRLQYGAIRAYSSRNNFHATIREALSHFERSLADVLAFPTNADPPVYVSMARAACADRQQVADRFMTDWEALVGETDTKLTRFFWSSLLSAVLTYHVNWVHSFASEPSEFRDCGTRVLVLAKDPALAGRLLRVLGFFVRLSVLVDGSSTSLQGSPRPSPLSPLSPLSLDNNFVFDTVYDQRSANHAAKDTEGRAESPNVVVRCLRNGSSLERLKTNGGGGGSSGSGGRRGGHQVENTRYLRNYYDVRFQLSPDTIAKRDARPFANLMSSIAKNGFHDFYADELADSGVSESKAGCAAFFVGSAPDHFESPGESSLSRSVGRRSESEPIHVQIPSLRAMKATSASASTRQHSHLLRWSYGTGLEPRYQPGRALQSCHPSSCDWLRELQTDLRAATAAASATSSSSSSSTTRTGTSVSCVVANTDTWEVQVLTSTTVDGSHPLRIKQNWVPVTMSAQVADLVESTHLLWSMLRNAEQCVDHVNSRLRLLCAKSEHLGAVLSASIQSWNVDRVTRLLGIEPSDVPVLMAACSVHSPVVSTMGGVTML